MNQEVKQLANALDKMLDAQLVENRDDAEARRNSAVSASVEAGVVEHQDEYQRLRNELLEKLDAEHADRLRKFAEVGHMEVDGALAALNEFRGRRGEIEKEIVVLDGVAALRKGR